ncbi:hypothetical protein [Pseudoclavibacter sp. JSM 162008]|uniref:hypothetical protein n=1 Tax=Pseudoclavibacter sp. JSM 162008 TaxID=3229855 RepID=UPI0035262841
MTRTYPSGPSSIHSWFSWVLCEEPPSPTLAGSTPIPHLGVTRTDADRSLARTNRGDGRARIGAQLSTRTGEDRDRTAFMMTGIALGVGFAIALQAAFDDMASKKK